MSHSPNPFSTRFIRPGAIAYRFEEGESAKTLVDRLESQGWLGEIIGPHGTGKSSLLEALAPELASRRRVVRFQLTATSPRLSLGQLFGGRWDAKTLVVIDGYEQLGAAARGLLAARRRLSGAGMLVTAHSRCGFPVLCETEGSEPRLAAIVEELVAGSGATISRSEVAQALQAAGGDMRDALFRLYDLYELRRNRE